MFKGEVLKKKNESCPHCDYTVANKWKMKRHIESKHNSAELPKNFQCEFCESSFRDKWKLERHRKTHSGGDLQCSSCQETFTTKYHRQRHEEIGKCIKKGNIKGRPKCTKNKSRTTTWREVKKTFDGMMSNAKVKSNVVNQIAKAENWGMKELTKDEAVNLITDISISDNQLSSL